MRVILAEITFEIANKPKNKNESESICVKARTTHKHRKESTIQFSYNSKFYVNSYSMFNGNHIQEL